MCVLLVSLQGGLKSAHQWGFHVPSNQKRVTTWPLLSHWDSDHEEMKVALNITCLLRTPKWKSPQYLYLPDIPPWILWQKQCAH